MELAHTTHGVVGGLKQAKSAFWEVKVTSLCERMSGPFPKMKLALSDLSVGVHVTFQLEKGQKAHTTKISFHKGGRGEAKRDGDSPSARDGTRD